MSYSARKQHAQAALMLFIAIFSFICVSGAEEAPLTAMEYYNSLPDDIDEEQYEKLYELMMAESSYVGAKAKLVVSSFPHSVLIEDLKTRREGTEGYTNGDSDYIYLPKQKARAAMLLRYKILINLEPENKEVNRYRYTRIVDIQHFSQTWKMRENCPMWGTSSHRIRELHELSVKFDPISKLEELAAVRVKELEFEGADKWEKLVSWKKAVDAFTDEQVGVESIAHWWWLEQNFKESDIFIAELPEPSKVSEVIGSMKQRDYIDKYINPRFVDTSHLRKWTFDLYRQSDTLAYSLAGYYIVREMGSPETLSRADLHTLERLVEVNGNANRIPPKPIFIRRLRCRMKWNEEDEKRRAALDSGYYVLDLLASGSTTNMTFCGDKHLTGSGIISGFKDRIYPQYHLVLTSDYRSEGQYRSVVKGFKQTAYLHASGKYFTWQNSSRGFYMGYRQVENHCPEVTIDCDLNYDVTDEGIMRLVKSEKMKRFSKGVNGVWFFDPEQIALNYSPIVTYKIDKVDYRIYQVSTRKQPLEKGLLTYAFNLIEFVPAKDAKVVEASVGMLYNKLDYWFKRGYFHYFASRPYYVEETYEDPKKKHIFEKARGFIDKFIAETYDKDKGKVKDKKE